MSEVTKSCDNCKYNYDNMIKILHDNNQSMDDSTRAYIENICFICNEFDEWKLYDE